MPRFFRQTKKVKPKYEIGNLVRTTDLWSSFSKGDTIIRPYKLYEIKEIDVDTIPGSRIDNLPDRYNEVLLKTTKLRLKESKNVMEAVGI